ncbi:MAG: type II secretion system protein GspC [Colwellia sp.]|nr:type II secretion system protein GspC [Colwellia sp.]
MQLPSNFSSTVDFLSQLPQQKIAKVISAILLTYIAYVLAQITWFIAPSGQYHASSNVTVKVTKQNTKTATISLTGLKTLNLFGLYTDEIEAIETAEVENVPETQLNLTLAGVVASDDKTASAAVIEKSGKQNTYSPGETITGTRAVLDSVFRDRVILKHAGKLETLMLDGFDYNETAKITKPKTVNRSSLTQKKRKQINNKLTSPNVLDRRTNKMLSKSAKLFKEDINSDPSKITDYLKISPKRKDGKIVGYRLMPGKKSQFFQNSGLKPGDVAIQMNGYDLTAPSEAAQALAALKQDKEVSLLIDRNGELNEILFSIGG